jgi:thiol:disulfide interchange protein
MTDTITKKKRPTAGSKYNYVSCDISRAKKWVASLNNLKLKARFETEEEAAYQANIWIKEHNLDTSKLNDIKKPEKFIEHQPKVKNELPEGITFKNGKYCARSGLNGTDIKLGTYSTLDEAIHARQTKEAEVKKEQNEKLLSIPIDKNENGECIMKMYIKKINETIEIIIDEDIYYDLIQHKWNINDSGSVCRQVDRKNVLLSKYVLGYDGNKRIEYINGNRLDNRKDNLCVKT